MSLQLVHGQRGDQQRHRVVTPPSKPRRSRSEASLEVWYDRQSAGARTRDHQIAHPVCRFVVCRVCAVSCASCDVRGVGYRTKESYCRGVAARKASGPSAVVRSHRVTITTHVHVRFWCVSAALGVSANSYTPTDHIPRTLRRFGVSVYCLSLSRLYGFTL